MRLVALAVIVFSVLICSSILAQQGTGLPNIQQAVFYAKYAAIVEVVEAKEIDPKNPWQWVSYKLSECLKGKFKEKEFEVMFIQSVNGSQGYAIPLPDSFVKPGEKYVIFFEEFKDKDGKEKLRAVTPDPSTTNLSATDEVLKEVKKHLKEWEKHNKELEKQRKKKSHISKDPFFKVTKANDDWLIIDLVKRKKEMIERSPSPQAKAEVERIFEGRKCEIFNQEAAATFVVRSKKSTSPTVRLEDIKQWVTEDIQKSLKNATITSAKMVQVSGERGYGFKYEWTTPDGKQKTNYERYVFCRKGNLFDIVMWCPSGNYSIIKKDFAKIMKSLRF